jgi:allantoinase
MSRFGLYSKRVVTPDGIKEATVVINDGKIEDIVLGKPGVNISVEDFGDSVIMSGLIDSHVHINEPGRTDWEGFETATKAAAAGGITTLIDMPLNSSPVTTNKEAFDVKMTAAKGKIHVNCGFYGGIVPDNLDDLELLIQSGVFGIKAFLTHSGIDDFPNVDEEDLRKALPILKQHNIPLLVHAELDEPHADQAMLEANPRSYAAYLKSRPKSWEDKAIQLMIDLCEEYDVRIHIVHLSSSNSIATLKQAIANGLPLSVETCPHYLVFNAEDIPDGQTQYKCAPPIREAANNEQLWKAVEDKLISFIVTDHSPSLPDLKELESGDFKKAWGGIAGLQFSLPVFWTQAQKRGFTIEDIARLMSLNIANFLGLDNRKGKLAIGFDADITIWNPEKEFAITEAIIQHRHKVTPYKEQTLKGVIERTYVAGNKAFDNGSFNKIPQGKILIKE